MVCDSGICGNINKNKNNILSIDCENPIVIAIIGC